MHARRLESMIPSVYPSAVRPTFASLGRAAFSFVRRHGRDGCGSLRQLRRHRTRLRYGAPQSGVAGRQLPRQPPVKRAHKWPQADLVGAVTDCGVVAPSMRARRTRRRSAVSASRALNVSVSVATWARRSSIRALSTASHASCRALSVEIGCVMLTDCDAVGRVTR